MKSSIYQILFFVFVVGIFLAPSIVMANGEYTPVSTLPGVFTKGVPVSATSIIAGIYNASIGIGSMLAVIMIIKGGMKYTVSEAIGSKEEAKKDIWYAVWGLLLLLTSFIILRTINVDLVNIRLDLSVPPGSGASGPAPTTPEGDNWCFYTANNTSGNNPSWHCDFGSNLQACEDARKSVSAVRKSASCTDEPIEEENWCYYTANARGGNVVWYCDFGSDQQACNNALEDVSAASKSRNCSNRRS